VALNVLGTAVFGAIYGYIVYSARRRRRVPGTGGPVMRGAALTMYAVALALTSEDAGSWGFLFTYAVAVAAMAFPPRYASLAVWVSPGVTALATGLGGAPSGAVLGYTASTAGVGLLMRRMADLRVRNVELSRARAELARLAVAEERQRFARDLHDLLGHSLSVIALKAELAGRLLPEGADAAAKEISELEQVARTALSEVREAVGGYRELTLAGELAGAQRALAAAGIEAEVEYPALELPAEVETVLAWAVREGATNVIRHSRATRCTLRIARTPEGAELEVIDDGTGPARRIAADPGLVVSSPGHGLRGLAERAEALAGTVQAGRSSAGFRLAVRVPWVRARVSAEATGT
jgi:two-component system sensor histidine kinase DesK